MDFNPIKKISAGNIFGPIALSTQAKEYCTEETISAFFIP